MMRDDWVEVELGELSEYVIGGDWGKKPDFADKDFEQTYCIRGAEFRDWQKNRGKTASLRKVKGTSLAKRELQRGDILVEISGGGPDQPVGRTVLIDDQVFLYLKDHKVVCTNFLRLFRPMQELNCKWLSIFLNYFYQAGGTIPYQGGSNNLRNLKFKQYLGIQIPLAPLPEQRAIVAKIEQLFSELDNGINNLKSARAKLEIYRQAVLKKAFEGELTKENLVLSKIGDHASIISGNAFKKSEYAKEGVRLFQIANVSFNRVVWDKKAFLPREYLQEERLSRLILEEGDLVMALNRPLLNNRLKIAILRKQDVPSILYQRVGKFKLSKNISSKFIFYYLQSSEFIGWLLEELRGVNIPFINQTKLLAYDKFPFTRLSSQLKIVAAIESRLSVCDKLAESIDQSLEKAEALRQSILKKAFSGKLLSEIELEACRQEPDWEPAKKLLERIKKDKSEEPKKKK